MRKEKIAVLGNGDLVLAFKAIGMDIFDAKDAHDASEKLRLLARNYSVIFITEDLCQLIEDSIVKYKTKAYPAIIPIPGATGSNGYGINSIKKDVERAIGTDILFND